jgi:hypothetical protein
MSDNEKMITVRAGCSCDRALDRGGRLSSRLVPVTTLSTYVPRDPITSSIALARLSS